MSFNSIQSWVKLGLLSWLFTSFLSAHDIEKVFAKAAIKEDVLVLNLELDVELLLSKKSPNGKIDLTRDWLYRLQEAQHEEIRSMALTFVQKSLKLSTGDQTKALAWDIQLPNYESQPYVFPPSFNNKALIEIVLTRSLTEEKGELALLWTPYDASPDPTLILEVEGQKAAVPILPGGRYVYAVLSSDKESALYEVNQLSVLEKLKKWLVIGFEHIIPKGYDHILFIIGLVLLSLNIKDLLTQSVLFTVAHSLTLLCATQGWVLFPIKWIEVLIALSIAYVGIENLYLKEVKPQRYYLVFVFGLLHGFGFASVLSDVLNVDGGGGSIALPLIGFNLGVEAGQIVVILLTFALMKVISKWNFEVAAKQYLSITIAVLSIVWACCRVFEFELF